MIRKFVDCSITPPKQQTFLAFTLGVERIQQLDAVTPRQQNGQLSYTFLASVYRGVYLVLPHW